MLQIIIIAGIGILAMLSEVLGFRKIMTWLAGIGIGAAITTSIMQHGQFNNWFNHMISDDGLSQALILFTLIIFLLWLITFRSIFKDEKNTTDYLTLVSFAVVGGLMMVSFTNLAILFLGIEILSIPVYVLAGSSKKSLKSNEAAFKYFLMGAFASGILLFGITFIYGATGSFDTTAIHDYYANNATSNTAFFSLGILLLIFAMSFKVSAVPFHFWTPDVYEGSPTPITAFMATLVKAFAAAAMFRLFYLFFDGAANPHTLGLGVICALTMLLGNILGAVQDNAKRTLAYSSIGHAGFMVLAIFAGGKSGQDALIYYIIAYSLASLLALFILHKVIVKDDFYQSIGDFNGLYKRNPLMALGMIISLLSMAGIPPLSGFFAKYFIFNAAYQNGYYWLVVVAIIASLIGVYYYFKFIIAMFRDVDGETNAIEINTMDNAIIIVLMALILGLGLMPDLIAAI